MEAAPASHPTALGARGSRILGKARRRIPRGILSAKGTEKQERRKSAKKSEREEIREGEGAKARVAAV